MDVINNLNNLLFQLIKTVAETEQNSLYRNNNYMADQKDQQ